MRFAAWSVLIYALLVAAGGIFGYVHAKSTLSLFASLPFAIVLLACAPGLFMGKRVSIIVSILLVFVLDAFFTFRFSKTLAWMPAGMMMLVSLVTLSAMVYGIRKAGKCSATRKSS